MSIQSYRGVEFVLQETGQTVEPIVSLSVSPVSQFEFVKQFFPRAPFPSAKPIPPPPLPLAPSLLALLPHRSAEEEECVRAAFEAISQGERETLEELLDEGLSKEAENSRGHFLIHEAVINGNIEIVKLLLDHGHDINKLTTSNSEALGETSGVTPLELAMNRSVAKEAANMIKFLISQGAQGVQGSNTLIFKALNKKSICILKILIQNGADLNCKNSKGRTPLFETVLSGSCKEVDFLLENGAKIDEPSLVSDLYLSEFGKSREPHEIQQTPLMGAFSHAKVAMFKLLLEKGADRSELRYMRHDFKQDYHWGTKERQDLFDIIDEELAKGKRPSDSPEERSSKEVRFLIEQAATRAPIISHPIPLPQPGSRAPIPSLLSLFHSSTPPPDSTPVLDEDF